MRRFLSFFLLFTLLVGVCAATGGDPNVDGGGGGMGDGTGDHAWNGGDDGVRISVMRGTTAVAIVDYSNADRSYVDSFVKRCKLAYKNSGYDLVPSVNTYTSKIPSTAMPRIINTSGGSNIAAIKDYFTDREIVEDIADDVGMTFDELTSGEYKLMLEPIAYFKYDGTQWAMTATEAALFDIQVGGDLKYWMGTLTHQNLPFAMFLERGEFLINAWPASSPTTGKQSNLDILNMLGVGIISFRIEAVEIVPSADEYEYRTNTNVVTAFTFTNGGGDITPDDNAYIDFMIMGTRYSRQFVCPGGASQLVWVRWRTPSTPQTINIQVTSSSIAGLNRTITANVTKLEEQTPPDPEFDGPGINAGQYQPNFQLVALPDWGSRTSTSWTQWVPVWHPPQTIHFEGGIGDVDIPGYWTFQMESYSAHLTVDYDLKPDDRVPTYFTTGDRQYEMKSGYGVNVDCEVRVRAAPAGSVSNYDITPVQNVTAGFPEFQFLTYSRLLEPEHSANYQTTWQFKSNVYSYYGKRVHFTPLWYPDAMDYPVPLYIFDAWTPGGQLYATVSDYIYIDGGATLDDWYIRLLT